MNLGILLPEPPAPFGAYVEAVQTGNLLFITGMLPTSGHAPVITGRLGSKLDSATGRKAARVAAYNGLAVARQYLGKLERVSRVVRLGVYIAVEPDFTDHAAVADGASEVFLEVFGPEKASSRMVFGVSSLPLGCPIELEVILEVT